ncbi:restriction endonuclease subunit S [Emticicia fontis]
MSRGRKANSGNVTQDWQEIFQKNAGAYFQTIIIELGKLNSFREENAFELLQNIKKERTKLKLIPVQPIKPNEIPYIIPKNWVWCRLGEITNYGSSPKAEPSDLTNNTWVLDLEDIEKGTSNLIHKIRFEERNSLSTKSIFKSGQVLYSKLRPYLDKVIVADEDGVCTTEILPLECYGGINPFYFRLALKRLDFLKYVNSVTKGMKMPRLGTKEGEMALIPLAPLTEQDRIIEFLTDLENNNLKPNGFYFNSEIENKIIKLHKSQILTLESSALISEQLTLIENLNQAILQEAVQGKLVPQDPTDEPASELLKRIKEEKAKSGKKEKPLPPIKPEEIPFEIPESWVWCRLGEMSINLDGDRKPISQADREKRKKIFDYYGASGVIDKIDGFTHEGELLLIGEDGANLISRSTPIAFIAKGKFWVNNHAHVLQTTDRTTLDYLSYFINSIDLKPFVTGGFQPKLSQGNLNIIPIALPPLSEQKRIVAEIENQLEKTKQLKAHVLANQAATEQLLKALLQEAFAVEEE